MPAIQQILLDSANRFVYTSARLGGDILKARSLRKISVITLLTLSLATSAAYGVASAKQNQGNGKPKRPGWGKGDKNHDHTGPPGSTNCKPGWGKGDKNHDHTGPPGKK